jgi:hypothetical protein
MLTISDLRKGDKVLLTSISFMSDEPRKATLLEKPRGTTAFVEIEGVDGYYNDFGSIYIDEILGKTNDDFEVIDDVILSDKQASKMREIRGFLNA